MEKVTMTVKEASQTLGISLPKMYELTEIEGFPVLKIGKRKKLIIADSFKEWLAKQHK